MFYSRVRLLYFILMITLAVLSGRVSAEEFMILTGNEWVQLDHGHKVMYVAGVAHVVEYERQLKGGEFSKDAKSFIPHLAEGFKGDQIGGVIEQIDAYYAANPGKKRDPVYHVIFQVLVFQ